MAHHFEKQNISHLERVSSFTSKGSITIEAAFALPIFLVAVLSLVYLLEMINLHTVMKSALHYAAKEMAEESYVNPLLIPGRLEQEIVDIIGEDRLDKSIVYGGSNGIDCRKSKVWGNSGIMDLLLSYKIEIPFLMFRIPIITQEEFVRVKGWNGYTGGGFGSQQEDMVYISENGIVYHKEADCTYLELSIKLVRKSDVKQLRNENGEKYGPCKLCAKKREGEVGVYITETGNRYHSSLGCGGIKRKVYAVPISEVYGRGGCSRCVK